MRQPLIVPQTGNQIWSADFMSDSLYYENGFRTYNVIDDFNREAIAIERFNRTYREDVLNLYLFKNLDEVRERTYWWMIGYNEERHHYAHGDLTPAEYMEQNAENSTLKVST